MIVDVAEMISEMNMGPLTLERASAPVQNSRGAYEPSTPAALVLDPVVTHTLTGRDLDQVPEANRTSEVRVFYATVRIYVADGGNDADVITFEGRKFRVFSSSNAAAEGGVYWANASLEDDQ
jgi:hypothetical protein